MTATIKQITDNPLWRLLTPILVFLLGIIGFLYVQGQEHLATKIDEAQRQSKENTLKVIKMETEFTEFRIYNSQFLGVLDKKIDGFSAKLDRFLENQK